MMWIWISETIILDRYRGDCILTSNLLGLFLWIVTKRRWRPDIFVLTIADYPAADANTNLRFAWSFFISFEEMLRYVFYCKHLARFHIKSSSLLWSWSFVRFGFLVWFLFNALFAVNLFNFVCQSFHLSLQKF